MKRLSLRLYCFRIMLLIVLAVPATTLAQTNFVKYVGSPVLPLGQSGSWDDTEAAYAAVISDGTDLHMWYSGAPTLNTYRIGYASSSDGMSWQKHAAGPVLDIGGSNDFDALSLWLPSVHYDGSNYQMWYAGGVTGPGIGYATSPDPVSWTRHQSTPVLSREGNAEWDGDRAFRPIVLVTDSLYHMWYGGNKDDVWQTGYASSTNGVDWDKHPNNPVLAVGLPGAWDSQGAIAGSVVYAEGMFHMWYHGLNRTDFSQVDIGYATSTNGIDWTKDVNNPILQRSSFGWDNRNVWFPHVIKDGHRYRMWYTGVQSGNIDRLGYAEDFSNAAHVDSVWARPQPLAALSEEEVLIHFNFANPRQENLTARIIIRSEDGSVSDSIAISDLDDESDGEAAVLWRLPDPEVREYTAGVVIQNGTADYVHSSFDWGVTASFTPARLTHNFTEVADIDEGDASATNALAFAEDGTIYVASGAGGLNAYTFNNEAFTIIGNVNDGGDAMGVGLAKDGAILLANGDAGLWAYSFNNVAFTSLASIDDGGSATDVAVAADSTIYLSNGNDGLRAYTFDGGTFTNTAHINNGGFATDIAIAADGTIFLANGQDGLRVYTYDGNSFTNTAYADEEEFGGGFPNGDNGVVVGEGNLVFVTNNYRNLRAYEYDGGQLSFISSIALLHDWPHALSAARDNTLFLAGSQNMISPGNLYAFTFDGGAFMMTAKASPDLTARDAVVAPDGRLFIANGERGIKVFDYSTIITSVSEESSPTPSEYALQQNYPNPFNPGTTIEFSLPAGGLTSIKIYNLLGKRVATVVEAHRTAGRHSVQFDAAGLPSGIYYYVLTAGDYREARKMLLLR